VTVTIERRRFKARHVAFIREVAQARPDAVIASDHNDQQVRSVCRQQQLVPNGSILWAAYKYVFAQFGELSLEHFDSLTSS
jgi:ABC-type polysaccharide/polyol phosphate transport system ATPase subunit